MRFAKSSGSLRLVLLMAPLVFTLHFLEEGADFVQWFNARVPEGITEPLFWSVNFTALGITLGIVLLEWVAPSTASTALAVAWLSFLMLANSIFHVAGALKDGGYVPGLVTALTLYLPFYGWFIARVLRLGRLSLGRVVIAAALGALPMLAHGYLIVYRGSRLF